MAMKWKVEEVETSELDSPKEQVTIHGVITEVSPVRKSRNNPNRKYLCGKITDGKKVLKLVSFDTGLQTDLEAS